MVLCDWIGSCMPYASVPGGIEAGIAGHSRTRSSSVLLPCSFRKLGTETTGNRVHRCPVSGGQVSWRDAAQVDEYVTRISTLPPRLAGEAVLVDVLPTAPRRVLDLGCGDGRLAAL